ncbi:MAG: FtsQ-type POTRA domain-containing protein, partial [Clostridia bacterium]|nr:FtsQ-type POTRA domain-containing protein [Clostridia bacterium]
MSDRLRTEDPELLFVYDRVCTQDEKNREMGQRFGVGVGVTGASREQPYRGSFADEGRRRSEEAARDPSSAPSRPGLNADGSDTGEFSRPRRSAAETFASSEGTREYAPAASFSRRTGSGGAGAFAFASHGDPSRGAAGAKASEPAGENRAYTYRPGTPEGGEAAAERRKRPGPEWFADIFVSRQARGKEEAREIKKSAAAEQRAREYRHAAVTALILTVVLALSAFLVYRIVFVIDQIEIGGSDRYSAAEIAGVVGIEEGDGLYSFRSAEVSAAVTFRMPWVKSAEIVRSAPKKVAVLLTDDEARYYANVWG